MHRITLIFLVVALAFLPGAAWAQAGVGVNVRSIQVAQNLAPGGIDNQPACAGTQPAAEPSGHLVMA